MISPKLSDSVSAMRQEIAMIRNDLAKTEELKSNEAKKIAQRLSSLQKDLQFGEEEIPRLREQYKGIINDFYMKNKPFPSNPKEFEFDLEQYANLISHTIYLDDLSFLKKWGFDYPKQSDFSTLAKPVSSYRIAFERYCVDEEYRVNNNIPSESVVYYKELLGWLN